METVLVDMGHITADVHEKNKTIRAAADSIEALESGDLRVTSDCGQTLTWERKSTSDFLKTAFSDGNNRLENQVAPTDGLIIEMDPMVLTTWWPEGADVAERILSAHKRLWHLAHVTRVIPTNNAAHTVAFLRYVASRKKPIEVFDTSLRINDVEPHMRLLGAFPLINPYRVLEGGERLGDALWDAVNKEKLAEALGIRAWDQLEGIGKGKVQKALEFLGLNSEGA